MESSAEGLAAHSLTADCSSNDLQHLHLSWSEVERLAGLEANDLWIGSLWTGAYRLGVLTRSPLAVLLTELLIIALAGVVSLPLGLLARSPVNPALSTAQAAAPFVITMAISMGVLLLLRYRCMARNRRCWRSLLAILDEVDRYHDSLKAIEVLEQFQAIHRSSPTDFHSDDGPARLEPATVQAIRLTRDSLVTGLLADRLLRQQQARQAGQLRKKLTSRSRYTDLLEHLDKNLATLTAFDVSQQLSNEAQLLQNALQISIAVRSNIVEPHHYATSSGPSPMSHQEES